MAEHSHIMSNRASNPFYDSGGVCSFGGLTPRQQEVVCLVARGLTNRAIADRLCVSPETVKHHLSTIMDRIGVPKRGGWNSRVLLARWLWNQER